MKPMPDELFIFHFITFVRGYTLHHRDRRNRDRIVLYLMFPARWWTSREIELKGKQPTANLDQRLIRIWCGCVQCIGVCSYVSIQL